jgi:flagellar biosynthesis protein FlhF
MKMKMFVGSTEEEAMAQVRAEMGPDAVVLSVRDEGDGRVEVRAAVERTFNVRATPKFAEQRPKFEAAREELSSTLGWHGAPEGFTDIVSQAGGRLGAGLEQIGSLSAGLEGVLTFNPIHPRPEKSLFLVGPHGSGKTTSAAKLARQMSSSESLLEAVSADFDCSGQAARLAAISLKVSVTTALSPDALVRIVAAADDEARRLVIDGPPFNPVDPDDMRRLRELISRMNVEPILVLSAEGHPLDLEDTARAYALAGCRRVILTRLDAVRRRGGAIAAISSSRLSIAQLGMTPSVRGGLYPASAERIARLLSAGAPEAEQLKGAA